MATLLFEGLNKKVVVTENARRCKINVREALVTQLIDKSATAELHATKMLLDLIKDAEKQTAAATAPEPSPRRHDALSQLHNHDHPVLPSSLRYVLVVLHDQNRFVAAGEMLSGRRSRP